MTRLVPKKRAELSPEEREEWDRIGLTRAPREDETYGGPFDPWIRSPEMSRLATGFGLFLWERTTIGRRLVELAILVTGRHWRSNVEWVAHARLARENGVAEETIDEIFAGRMPANAPADERLVYEVASSLHVRHALDDALYARAVEAFGERGLVEIIGTIGLYSMVSMTLNAFRVPAAGVEEQPFPEH